MQNRTNLFATLLTTAGTLTLAATTALTPIRALAEPSDMELQIVRNAKLSLIEAVEVAQREVGGRVVEAELDQDDDMYFYELEVVSDAGLVLLYMNPASGVIVGRRHPGLTVGAVGGRHRDRAEALAGKPDALIQALRTAESETGGRAVQIETERDDGRYVFEVTTIQDALRHELQIDLQSGRVLDINQDD